MMYQHCVSIQYRAGFFVYPMFNAIWTSSPRVAEFLKSPPRGGGFFSTARYKQIPILNLKNMDINGFSTLQVVLIYRIIMFIPPKQALQFSFFNSCWGSHPSN